MKRCVSYFSSLVKISAMDIKSLKSCKKKCFLLFFLVFLKQLGFDLESLDHSTQIIFKYYKSILFR